MARQLLWRAALSALAWLAACSVVNAPDDVEPGPGGSTASGGQGGTGAQGGTGGQGGQLPVCGDGAIDAGSEDCDDHNTTDADGCSSTCSVEDGYLCTGEPSQCSTVCGDGIIVDGHEECDDSNPTPNDGCSDGCVVEDGYDCTGEPSQCTPLCGNPDGGPVVADNGAGLNESYCYGPNDNTQIRAQKACESHFGVGACCVIPVGYQEMQYGECNMDGGVGTFHWHWDDHPGGAHCEPYYVIGDVLSPGWCGVVVGNFL